MRKKIRMFKSREAAVKHKKATRRHDRNLETLTSRIVDAKREHCLLLEKGFINTAMALHRTRIRPLLDMRVACQRIRHDLALHKAVA